MDDGSGSCSEGTEAGCYDHLAKDLTCPVSDRVFVLMPAAKAGKAHKFARPFHGPYWVLEVTNSDDGVVPVDKPQGSPIFVALSQIRHCPGEIPEGETWPQSKKKRTPLAMEPLDELTAFPCGGGAESQQLVSVS